MGSKGEDLPEELLLMISRHLDSHIDRVRFALVCRSWRSAAIKQYHLSGTGIGTGTGGRFPWLLTEWSRNNATTTTTFSISGDGIKKGYIFPDDPLNRIRIVGSIAGSLILLFQDERIEIMNLLTRAIIPLPPRTSLEVVQPDDIPNGWGIPFRRWALYTHKIALSSTPSDPDCIAAAISRRWKLLAFARPRDATWTTIHYPWPDTEYLDLAFYKGKLWAVDHMGQLAVCDVAHPNPTATRASLPPLDGFWHPARYLVEIKGMLVQVVRDFGRVKPDAPRMHPDFRATQTFGFKVYVLRRPCEWVKINSLWGHNLFIGANTSIALEPTESGHNRDCIFYLDMDRGVFFDSDRGVEKCCGIFNLATDTMSKFPLSSNMDPFQYPPLWITPHL